MSEDSKNKVRYCAMENCTVRMSSCEKDRHVLCPTHTGWQCKWDVRCNVCQDWPDTLMREYVKLTEGKARKKAYKDKQKALKAANEPADERHAHLLSPSSSSAASVVGEPVPVVFDRPVIDNVNKLIDSGVGNSNKDLIACTPSVNPPAVGVLDQLGQGPVVPCGDNSLALKGSLDPRPLMVAGEPPSHTGQPPQALTTPHSGDVGRTPATARSVRSGSLKLTPGAYSTLMAVLDDHEEESREDKMHRMLQTLMDNDPKFKGSLRGSGRSEKSVKTAGSSRIGSSVKSAVPRRQSSLTREPLGVVPLPGCSTESPNRLELTREWAKMVQTGGVTVKEGTSCYYKDSQGVAQFVKPPTDSRQGGGV